MNLKRRTIAVTERIFLSPPHMAGDEIKFVGDAFESNYIAPVGPQVDAFEKEICEYTGFRHAVALSSGTAAMHLALHNLGVEPGDEVFASTLTFIGSVSPVTFLGATPVFIDCDRETWNMDPDLLEQELKQSEQRGKLPKAVVPTDLYGQCCNLPKIVEICSRYDVPVICDSAEAMGAWYRSAEGQVLSAEYGKGEIDTGNKKLLEPKQSAANNHHSLPNTQNSTLSTQHSALSTWQHAGRDAKAAVFSFNGNKIMTTSGGGMLVSDDEEFIEKARFLSQQARDPAPHYEHREIGYNYRMSNILAAIGRGQLGCLEDRVEKRCEIFRIYRKSLGETPGVSFMPEAQNVRSNKWLTVLLVSPNEFGADRETVRMALEAENIEARPVWKPMHMQPVFWNVDGGKSTVSPKRHYPCRVVGGAVSEHLFERGLCLPSGTAMSQIDLDRVVKIILETRNLGGAAGLAPCSDSLAVSN